MAQTTNIMCKFCVSAPKFLRVPTEDMKVALPAHTVTDVTLIIFWIHHGPHSILVLHLYAVKRPGCRLFHDSVRRLIPLWIASFPSLSFVVGEFLGIQWLSTPHGHVPCGDMFTVFEELVWLGGRFRCCCCCCRRCRCCYCCIPFSHVLSTTNVSSAA